MFYVDSTFPDLMIWIETTHIKWKKKPCCVRVYCAAVYQLLAYERVPRNAVTVKMDDYQIPKKIDACLP